jgi:hypothetical protein
MPKKVADVAPVAYPVSVGEHSNYIEAMLNLDLDGVRNLSDARLMLNVKETAVREFLLTNLSFDVRKETCANKECLTFKKRVVVLIGSRR